VRSRLRRGDLNNKQIERPAGWRAFALWLFPVIGLRPIVVLRWRPVVLAVLDDHHRLFGGPLVLVFALRKRANRRDNQYHQHHDLSQKPHHFRRCLLMLFARMGGRRDAPSTKAAIKMPQTPSRLRCVFYAESLASCPRIRTVSSYFAPYRAAALSPHCDTKGADISARVERS